MFFGHISHTNITFTWLIVGTTSLLISITFVVYLMPKQWRCLFRTTFSTSGKVSSFALLLGLTGSWTVSFLVIKVSEVFFLLFLRRIRCWSGATLDKFNICPDRKETPKLSLQISIYEGFSILVLLLDKLVLEIDLDWFNLLTVFSMSIIRVELDLSNDLPLSYLLQLDVSTVLLDNCDLSVFLLCHLFLQRE